MQKIDNITLEIYKMVIFTFSVSDKDGRERFFEESFLLADVKPDIMLEMSFLTMSNIGINFQARDLQYRSYIIADVFPTSREVELIGTKKFVVVTLYPEHKVLVIYIGALNIDSGDEMHPSKRAQIPYLKADKAPAKVLVQYADFADVFLLKLAIKLSKYIRINNHIIKLVDD